MSGSGDNFLLLLEKMTEVSERTARIETKMEVMEKDIEFIKDEDRKQNDLLDQHIAGVKTNTSRLEEEKLARQSAEKLIENRLNSLEESPKFWKSLAKRITGAGAVAGAIYGIMKLLEYL